MPDYVHNHADNPAIFMHGETVARFTMVGGYPVYWVTYGADVLCSTCVAENIIECCEPGPGQIDAHGINWEDPHLHCDNCGDRIESAYAEWEAGVSR